MRRATSCAWLTWLPPALRGQAAGGDEPGLGGAVGVGVGLGVGLAVTGGGVGVGGREADGGGGVGEGRASGAAQAAATMPSVRRTPA